MDLQEQMGAIGLTDSEAPPAEPVEQDPNAPQAAEGEPQAATEPDLKSELDLLKRVVAKDPNLRQQYVAEKLGLEYTPPIPQQEQPQQEQQPAPEAPQQVSLPFDPAEYDATNFEHQAALVGVTVQNMLSHFLQPFHQWMQEERQAAQQQQVTQAQLVDQRLDQDLNQFTDTLIPGFSGLWDKTRSPEEDMVLSHAGKLFAETQAQYPANIRKHPKVLQEVVKTIAPQVKQLADRLGVLGAPQPTPTQRPPGAYVEPVSPVPTPVARSKFDDAYAKKDVRGMMSAIGRTT